MWVGSSVGQTIAFVIGRCGQAGSAFPFVCCLAGRRVCGLSLPMVLQLVRHCAVLCWLSSAEPDEGDATKPALSFDLWARRYLLRELVVQYLTKQFPKWTAIDKALETGACAVTTAACLQGAGLCKAAPEHTRVPLVVARFCVRK